MDTIRGGGVHGGKQLSGGSRKTRFDHPRWQLGYAREGPLAERTPEKLQNARPLHMLAKRAQQLESPEWTQEEPVGKQQHVPLLPDPVHHLARKHRRINVRALEPFVPVAFIVDDPARDVFAPEWRASVDAQTVEAECVQLEPGREAEALQDLVLGLVR